MNLNVKPKVDQKFKLQFEQAQNCFVLLYPEGMIKLNYSASTILRKCDGKNSISDIIDAINQEVADDEVDVSNDVVEFIEQSYTKQWLSI